jgi:hypothetical protein
MLSRSESIYGRIACPLLNQQYGLAAKWLVARLFGDRLLLLQHVVRVAFVADFFYRSVVYHIMQQIPDTSASETQSVSKLIDFALTVLFNEIDYELLSIGSRCR